MLSFVAYIVGLVGTLVLTAAGVTYIMIVLAGRRLGPVRVVAGMVSGYVAGMLFFWALVPRDWPLGFWTTLAATVNAEKYGHPVEHAAEGIIDAMLFAAVVGSLIGGFAAHTVGQRLGNRAVPHAR